MPNEMHIITRAKVEINVLTMELKKGSPCDVLQRLVGTVNAGASPTMGRPTQNRVHRNTVSDCDRNAPASRQTKSLCPFHWVLLNEGHNTLPTGITRWQTVSEMRNTQRIVRAGAFETKPGQRPNEGMSFEILTHAI